MSNEILINRERVPNYFIHDISQDSLIVLKIEIVEPNLDHGDLKWDRNESEIQ